ncbi:beta-lactamase family protein [Streptomyces sp. BH-SS-21]|uniref:Beta-lactamase family protein n=1 Tax=Streptomyces liliiviolaceus TaxID=2823109 RepID=A0A941B5E2_9ACTN|nr:serine hydrolase domain-containing protein [Streptomyces liliiviolaceus]MBQ0848126.1 beta-lactamase family protein [Streptomyces liliiviolaceus]
MRRPTVRRTLCAALLAASLWAPTAVHPAVAEQRPAAVHPGEGDCPNGLGRTLTSRLDKAMDDVGRKAGIPGAVVGLWMPGKGCYVRSMGVADTRTGEPMSADSFVRIGSETKTFTVTALLELVDEGRVGLDDPISAYVKGVPDGHRITLRHLAGMRSGLFPYTEDADFVQDLLSDPQRTFTPRQSLAYGFKHRNTFAPGAKFQYSNSNLVLLGMVIEKVTGHRLADVVHDRVLRPAHLRNTLFPQGDEFPHPHPRGYTDQTLSGEVADATDWNPSWAWAAGAMISNLHDLRTWARSVATGQLLSPGTQKQRLRTLPTGIPGTTYGLGILNTHGWIGHNGSIPGYETVTVHLPPQKATLVVMMNTDILSEGQEPSTLLARAITTVATPKNIYDGSATAP